MNGRGGAGKRGWGRRVAGASCRGGTLPKLKYQARTRLTAGAARVRIPFRRAASGAWRPFMNKFLMPRGSTRAHDTEGCMRVRRGTRNDARGGAMEHANLQVGCRGCGDDAACRAADARPSFRGAEEPHARPGRRAPSRPSGRGTGCRGLSLRACGRGAVGLGARARRGGGRRAARGGRRAAAHPSSTRASRPTPCSGRRA